MTETEAQVVTRLKFDMFTDENNSYYVKSTKLPANMF